MPLQKSAPWPYSSQGSVPSNLDLAAGPFAMAPISWKILHMNPAPASVKAGECTYLRAIAPHGFPHPSLCIHKCGSTLSIYLTTPVIADVLMLMHPVHMCFYKTILSPDGWL